MAATSKWFDDSRQKCDAAGAMNRDAYILREGTGTSSVLQTARTAAELLADHGIPHLVVGGIAVQEHGYPRVTIDVDLVVPDVLAAVEFLTAGLSGPFYRVAEAADRVEDRSTHTFVDLLPAGSVVKNGCKVPFPMPTTAAGALQIVTLEVLISLKLDSWANSPLKRLRDRSDVVELILRRKLLRDLAVNLSVRTLYDETWDAIQAEK